MDYFTRVVSHCFVDDLFVFANGDVGSINIMNEALVSLSKPLVCT